MANPNIFRESKKKKYLPRKTEKKLKKSNILMKHIVSKYNSTNLEYFQCSNSSSFKKRLIYILKLKVSTIIFD